MGSYYQILRQLLNIQCMHWLIILATAVLVRRFGFCQGLVDYLGTLNLDFVTVALGVAASARGVWVRWRNKARIKVAAALPQGASEEAVSRITKQDGVFATLKG